VVTGEDERRGSLASRVFGRGSDPVFFGAAVGAVAQEAGKDMWHGLKKLVSGIWSKQSGRSYRLNARANLVFEHGENFVALSLRGPVTARGQGTAGYFEEQLDRQIAALRDRVDDLASVIDALPTERSVLSGKPRIYWVVPNEGGDVDTVELDSWNHSLLSVERRSRRL
jgi:hypothetical protein